MLFDSRRSGACLCLFSAMLFVSGCRHANEPANTATAASLRSDVEAHQLSALRWPNFSDYGSLVQTFYNSRGWKPAWVSGRKPTPQAQQLIVLFRESAAKGLQPEDYDASRWGGRLAQLGSASDADLAQFDLAVTVSAMRYISDLHIGRVNPSRFAFGVNVEAKKYDLPQFVAQVADAGDVAKALASIEPNTQQYHDSLAALGKYQAMAASEKLQHLQLLPLPGKPVAPGSAYSGAATLRQRLHLVGDLPSASQPGPSAAAATYDPQLADAVKHFQLRHGLPNDGKLTQQTVAALNVPMEVRVHQLEDSLERWRWLSNEYLNAPVIVNIPEFALRAYGDGHKVDFMMRVVVGDSLKEEHKTPVLTQTMKYIVMRPYWTVTTNILKKEIIPRLETNKNYLKEKNFEVVDRGGRVVPNWDLNELEHGGLTVREKPGPQNSLGLIKFMFPNKYDIYLHSTPAVQLFDRNKRDFSHGCIRLEDPEKLADWVLREDPEWSPEKIHDAMENGEDNHIVLLKKPMPVVIFYATALVVGQGPEQGQVYFFDDTYGYDKDLETVLAQGMPYPVKPEPKPQDTDTE